MKNNQIGRSMIEMLGVLSIIGVLSVGGFSMVKKMQNSYDTNKIIEEISNFTQRAKILLREYESGDMNTFLANAKAYPDGVSVSGSSFVGTSDVTYTFSAGTGTTLFEFKIGALPEEVCMQVATADWGTVASSGFKGIKVGTGSLSTTPLSLSTAAGVCDGANNSISMYYR